MLKNLLSCIPPPYISLVVIIFSLPAILFALGLGALLTPFAFMGGVRYGFSLKFSTLFLLTTLVFQVAAIPGLFAREMSVWKNFITPHYLERFILY